MFIQSCNNKHNKYNFNNNNNNKDNKRELLYGQNFGNTTTLYEELKILMN